MGKVVTGLSISLDGSSPDRTTVLAIRSATAAEGCLTGGAPGVRRWGPTIASSHRSAVVPSSRTCSTVERSSPVVAPSTSLRDGEAIIRSGHVLLAHPRPTGAMGRPRHRRNSCHRRHREHSGTGAGGGRRPDHRSLRAGLLDEIQLNLVPTLLGGGVELFAGLSGERFDLECTSAVPSDEVTHLAYRVIR